MQHDWQLLSTETSLIQGSISHHGFISASPVLNNLEQLCTKNNLAGKNNQNREVRQPINLHCFSPKG